MKVRFLSYADVAVTCCRGGCFPNNDSVTADKIAKIKAAADGERRRRQSAQVVSQESRGLKRKEPDAPLGEPVVPEWSVATDQVAFSASQTLRGLEQVVLRERAEDGGWSKTHDMPVLRNGDKVYVLTLPDDEDTFVKVYPRDHVKYPEVNFKPECAGFIRRHWLARLSRKEDRMGRNECLDSELPSLGEPLVDMDDGTLSSFSS